MKYVVLFLFFLTKLALSSELEHGIKVVGNCKQRVKPDRVAVKFKVETLKNTVKDSAALANSKYNKLLEELKSLKLENVEFETFEYTTSPYKVYENKKRVLKGFKTRIGLNVSTSETKKAGEILQVGSELGQDFIEGPNAYVSDEKIETYYEKCLVIASKDAQEKAEVVAKSLGVVLGKAFNVKEVTVSRPHYKSEFSKGMVMSDLASAAPAKIQFGKSDIKLQLEVYFTIN